MHLLYFKSPTDIIDVFGSLESVSVWRTSVGINICIVTNEFNSVITIYEWAV